MSQWGKHQVIVLGMGYECGDGCQRSGKSQTGFKGAQTSGGQVGHTVAVIIWHPWTGCLSSHCSSHWGTSCWTLRRHGRPRHIGLAARAGLEVGAPPPLGRLNSGSCLQSWRGSFPRIWQKLHCQCCGKSKILGRPMDHPWLIVGWSVSVVGGPSMIYWDHKIN